MDPRLCGDDMEGWIRNTLRYFMNSLEKDKISKYKGKKRAGLKNPAKFNREVSRLGDVGSIMLTLRARRPYI